MRHKLFDQLLHDTNDKVYYYISNRTHSKIRTIVKNIVQRDVFRLTGDVVGREVLSRINEKN